VWYEGLSGWLRAADLPELSDVFASSVDRCEVSSGSPSNVIKRKMFANPFSFHGRIRRLEYGLSYIISSVIGVIISTILFLVSLDLNIGSIPLLYILLLPVYWFSLAQGCKRSHDTGNSGWWQLLPFYNIFLFFVPGNHGDNEYGSSPKGK
jgi:uncharacterized membrane protein YhaH (DUF805 family)